MTVRKGQAAGKLGRDEFRLVFHKSFMDPAFKAVAGALDQVEQTAWDNYDASHKAPVTERAGAGFADPDYQLSVEWKAARERLLAAIRIRPRPRGSRRRSPRRSSWRGGIIRSTWPGGCTGSSCTATWPVSK